MCLLVEKKKKCKGGGYFINMYSEIFNYFRPYFHVHVNQY